jgi:hypothetical protein
MLVGPRLGPRSLSASRLSRTGQRARRPAGASAEPSRKPPSLAADACLSERNYIALGSASAPLAELMIAPMASFGIYELYRQMAEEQSVRESARIAGSYLKQNYEMLAERARGLLSGEVSRLDEHETRRHTI